MLRRLLLIFSIVKIAYSQLVISAPKELKSLFDGTEILT